MDRQLSFAELIAGLPGDGFPGTPQTSFQVSTSENFFVPPELLLRRQFEDLDAPVALVSARGAAGKSRVANELSRRLGAPLWRLEQDKAVGATSLSFTLSQYLNTADVPAALRDARSPLVVIDSLDEARARVSGTSWREFLQSIAKTVRLGCRFVLFGRERTLEEVWFGLAEDGVEAGWLEISHFAADQRRRYVDEVVTRRSNPTTIRGSHYQAARDAVLRSLISSISGVASETFAGYPPVLDAVAAVLLRADNHYALVQTLTNNNHNGDHLGELEQLLQNLLTRDQKKMEVLARDLGIDPDTAYGPDEQLEWLCHELEDGPEPDLSRIRDPKVRSNYLERIRPFLNDHPFRDEKRWASTVFAAYVASRRFGTRIRGRRLIEIGNDSILLFDLVSLQEDPLIDESGFAALHASVTAGGFSGVRASVTVSELSADEYDVTMDLQRSGRSSRKAFTLIPERQNSLQLLGPLEDLTVVTSGELVIPARETPTVLGADVFFQCSTLTIEGTTIEFAHRALPDSTNSNLESTVTIEVSTPGIRLPASIAREPRPGAFELRVPRDAKIAYPWIDYRRDLESAEALNPNDRAVRFLKMFMNLTRAHGHQGERGTFIKKLQGRQALKGVEFQTAVDVLRARGVASVSGQMIYLCEPWEKHSFSGKTVHGLRTIEDVWDHWEPIATEITRHIG